MYENNNFKVSGTSWNKKSKLLDGSYSVSNIADYLNKSSRSIERLLHLLHKSPVILYVSKIQNRITLKIKTGYYLELSAPETMKVLGSIEREIADDKNGENVSQLELPEMILIHCNIANDQY